MSPTHLAVELWIQIAKYLPGTDLRTLRFVSKDVESAATATLFSTVYLNLTADSFRVLLDISRHPVLSKLVRKISYDGRYVWIRTEDYHGNFKAWLQQIGTRFELWQEPVLEEFRKLSRKEQSRIFKRYRRYIQGQEYLRHGDHEKALLVLALASFPSLNRITYHEPEGRSPGLDYELDLSNMSSTVQQIFCEAKCDDLKGSNHFWNIVEASAMTHARLSVLRGKHLDLLRWLDRAAKPSVFRPLPEDHIMDLEAIHNTDIVQSRSEGRDEISSEDGKEGFDTPADTGLRINCLSKLQNLSLEFTQEADIYEESLTTLARLLKQVPDLHRLRISFDWLPSAYRVCVPRLPKVIDISVTWTRLHHLSLQAMVTSSNDLQWLLKRHSTTLRSLHLAHMTFSRPVSGTELQSSWISFFQFLHDELSLDRVRFDGKLMNGFDEAWCTFDWGDDAFNEYKTGKIQPYDQNCLRYRIERYVTRAGSCPFRAVPQVVQETLSRIKTIQRFWDKVEGGSDDTEDDPFYDLFDEAFNGADGDHMDSEGRVPDGIDDGDEFYNRNSEDDGNDYDIPWRWEKDKTWVFVAPRRA